MIDVSLTVDQINFILKAIGFYQESSIDFIKEVVQMDRDTREREGRTEPAPATRDFFTITVDEWKMIVAITNLFSEAEIKE